MRSQHRILPVRWKVCAPVSQTPLAFLRHQPSASPLLQQALACVCLGSYRTSRSLWALWTAPPNIALRGPGEPTGSTPCGLAWWGRGCGFQSLCKGLSVLLSWIGEKATAQACSLISPCPRTGKLNGPLHCPLSSSVRRSQTSVRHSIQEGQMPGPLPSRASVEGGRQQQCLSGGTRLKHTKPLTASSNHVCEQHSLGCTCPASSLHSTGCCALHYSRDGFTDIREAS